MANHNDFGKKGEKMATNFLVKNGFKILEKNFQRPWGEIDIIGRRGGVLHFFEVKTFSKSHRGMQGVDFDEYADRISFEKRRRLKRIIETYLIKQGLEDMDWQVDIIFVVEEVGEKPAFEILENVVL